MNTPTKKQLALSWYSKVDNTFSMHTNYLAIEICVLENDGTPDNPKWRNIGSMSDHECYDDLRVTAHASDKDNGGAYAYDLEYRDVYSVDLRRAKLMAQTLRALDTKLERMKSVEGYAQNFGQYVNRVARAIGAQGLLFWEGKSTNYNMDTYRTTRLPDIPYRVEQEIAEFHEKYPKQATA